MSYPGAKNPFLPEPSGFPTTFASDATMSFTDGTRTFTITPTGTSFSFDASGVRYNSVAQSVQISNDVGMHAIYMDASGELQSDLFANLDLDVLFTQYAIVSLVYWDGSSHLYLADERHGKIMDGATHVYAHKTQGTKWESGLALGDFSVDEANPGSNAAAQFSCSNGSIIDEDLTIDIADGSPQDLSPIAQIPVFYLSGSGAWNKDPATAFPVKSYSGGSNLLAWNELTGGVWQQTEVGNNQYVLAHIWATNDIENPIIALQGQAVYGSIIAARVGAEEEINNLITTGLLFAEFIPIGSVIYQTSTSISGNAVLAKIRSTDEGSNYVDLRSVKISSTGSANDHGNLAGLSGDDHLQYALLAGRAGDNLVLANDDTTPPLNMTERSAAQSSPNTGDIYLDDGTNWGGGAGTPGFMRYTGAAWEDIGGGGGGSSVTVAQTVYVAKHGNDANDGRSIETAKLTIASAVTVAAGLTPSASNIIDILIYDGRYDETLTPSSDYVNFIGVGKVEVRPLSGQALNNARDSVEFRNITFVRVSGSGSAHTNSGDTRVVNCKFTSEAVGSGYLTSTGETDYIGCTFETPNDTGNVCAVISGTARIFSSKVLGIFRVNGGIVEIHGSSLSCSATSLETIYNSNDCTRLVIEGCYVENTGAGGCISTRQNVSILGCRLNASSGFDVEGEAESEIVVIRGTSMAQGCDADVYIAGGVHRVAESGSCDFHKTLDAAIQALGSYGGTVKVERNVSISGTITVNEPVVIDGGSNDHTIASSAGNLFSIAAGSEVVLRNLHITDGDIDISGNGATLRIEGCKIESQLDISAGDGTTDIAIVDSDFVQATTDASAINVGDVDPILKIQNSHIQGNGTGPAISIAADNPNLYLWNSFFIGSDPPIGNPSGSTNIHTVANYLTAALPVNWSNQVSAPGDNVDANFANFPALRV